MIGEGGACKGGRAWEGYEGRADESDLINGFIYDRTYPE
jgi:hypothetical protein